MLYGLHSYSILVLTENDQPLSSQWILRDVAEKNLLGTAPRLREKKRLVLGYDCPGGKID